MHMATHDLDFQPHNHEFHPCVRPVGRIRALTNLYQLTRLHPVWKSLDACLRTAAHGRMAPFSFYHLSIIIGLGHEARSRRA